MTNDRPSGKSASYLRFEKKFREATPIKRNIMMVLHPFKATRYFDELDRQDRTLRKELADQLAFMRVILDGITDPIHVIDAKTYDIQFANATANLGEIVPGMKCHKVTHHLDKPCSHAEHQCPLAEVVRTAKPASTEHIHYDKDGRQRVCEVHAYPILDEEGRVKSVIEHSRDITERKLKQRELDRKNLELADMAKMTALGELIGGIAHDINGALTGPVAANSLIVSELERMRNMLNDSSQIGTDVVLAMLNKIGVYTHMIEAGHNIVKSLVQGVSFYCRKDHSLGPFSVEEAVRSAVTLSNAGLGLGTDRAKRATVVIDDNSPKVFAYGNSAEFQSVIINLISNAVKEFRPGEKNNILISWQREICPDGGCLVVVRVSNNGPDIPAEKLEKMFKERMDSTHGGEGVGLLNVKRLISRAGGAITVESGGGNTTFEITLCEVDECGKRVSQNGGIDRPRQNPPAIFSP